MRRFALVAMLLGATAFGAETRIESGEVMWRFDAETLALAGERAGAKFVVHLGRARSGGPLAAEAVAIRDGGLEVRLTSAANQAVAWPQVPLVHATDRLLWPSGEGVAFALADPFWRPEITGAEWPMGEAMSLPVWGLERGDSTLSCWLVSSPFRNTATFASNDSQTTLTMTQDFAPKLADRRAVCRFWLDRRGDVLLLAKHYRDFRSEVPGFTTLAERAKTRPEVGKLLGAAHVYLWGSQPLAPKDVLPKRWKPLCDALVAGAADPKSFAGHLKASFSASQWKAVEECAATGQAYAYVKSEIAAGLSAALLSPAFREHPDCSSLPLPKDAMGLYVMARPMTPSESIYLSSCMLAGAFPETFVEPRRWGNGVSLKMLYALRDAGLDRLKLCTQGEEDLRLRPWVAEAAKANGWLIGTYDSYHSIHNPKLAGSEGTWPTAQMTQELYDHATVTNADGTLQKGFQGKGRKLDSLAGRAFMERRVRANFAAVPYNYYFMDCDGTGEVYDNFATTSTLTMELDAAERARRLAWIGSEFQAVIGTEGGNAYIHPSVDVAEGIFGPFFGWDVPEMKDPKSEFFRGRYYPPDGPDVNFKPVPLLEKARRRHYDPTHQIPLHAAAFHDVAVVTAHWSNAHFKYPEVRASVALREVLYLAPPMYHLNLAEWKKREKAIREHYAVWSPLHRAHGFAALESFRVLDAQGEVQETTFAGGCRIVANFAATPWRDADAEIPPMSARIVAPKVWAEPRVYTPGR